MKSIPLRRTDQERRNHRLSDKIRAAFEQACDEEDLVTAGELLAALELVLLKTPPTMEQRDNVLGALYACQARLFNLKHDAITRNNGINGSGGGGGDGDRHGHIWGMTTQ
jgi:hypothetical protein